MRRWWDEKTYDERFEKDNKELILLILLKSYSFIFLILSYCYDQRFFVFFLFLII